MEHIMKRKNQSISGAGEKQGEKADSYPMGVQEVNSSCTKDLNGKADF